jgi:hypothetical protein
VNKTIRTVKPEGFTLVISHSGPYDFYIQKSRHFFRFHWGYFDLTLITLQPTVAIPLLRDAMLAEDKDEN